MMISKLADLIENYMKEYGLTQPEAAKKIKNDLHDARILHLKRQRPRNGAKP